MTFIQWQDIELNSKNYSYPVRPRDVDIYTTVGKKLFQEIHAYFQVVKIETDLDFIGFDEFDYIKDDVYLKYDEMVIMSNIIENDISETGEPFCDFTIKLSENVRIHRRTYTTLITILGDVGGLMEVLFTLFRLITSFSIDILYEISLVNNLFNFNLDKKVLILKDKKIKQNILLKNIPPKIYSPKRKIRVLSSRNLNYISEEDNIESIKRIDEDNNIKLSSNNENPLIVKFEKKKQSRRKSHILQIQDSPNNLFSLRKRNINNKDDKNKNNLNTNNSIKEDKEAEEHIINKIKMTRACIYLCFCCTRRRNIMQNVLIDEGMHIISEQLDVFNIFEQLYKNEKNQEKEKATGIIEMSDICKLKLRSFHNKIT